MVYLQKLGFSLFADAPVVEIERESVNSGLGRKAQLMCKVLAEPKANVTWYKDGARLPPMPRDPELPSHIWRLQLDSVSKSDYGRYACAAHNGYGHEQKLIELSATPSQPLLRSHKVGDDGASYSLVWDLDSAAKVEKYKLRWRQVRNNI